MKKILLSLLVLGLFIGYGLHERQEKAEIRSSVVASETPAVQTNSGSAGTPPTDTQPTTTTQAPTGTYKDGEYTGDSTDAFYGFIQVKAIIKGGKIADVQFLSYPNDRGDSIEINRDAMPRLTAEAIQAQSANVDIVSGATDSSEAFKKSLASALAKAQ